jgi:hypothetical protein
MKLPRRHGFGKGKDTGDAGFSRFSRNGRDQPARRPRKQFVTFSGEADAALPA